LLLDIFGSPKSKPGSSAVAGHPAMATVPLAAIDLTKPLLSIFAVDKAPTSDGVYAGSHQIKLIQPAKRVAKPVQEGNVYQPATEVDEQIPIPRTVSTSSK
jgi:hypothetical protein